MAVPATPASPTEVNEYASAHLPGLPPPSPEIIPNFVNPCNHQDLIVFTRAITLTVSTIFVILRTYTRHFINKTGLSWDDYLSLVAWAGYVSYASLGHQVIHHGGFIHQWNVPALEVMRFLKIVNWLQILYCPVILVTKLSILLQIKHIFAPAHRNAAHYLCHLMIWFNLLFYIAIMFVAIFACTPRRKFWNPTIPGHCLNINTVNIITSVINAASDLTLMLLPIVCVFQLQMTLKNKLGVAAVFAAGAFACISSIMRIVTSVQVSHTKDVTWGILPEGLWALGEISSGIIAGCLPTLPQFFRHFIPKITSRLSSGRTGKLSAGGSSKQSAGVRIRSPHAASSENYVELHEGPMAMRNDRVGKGKSLGAPRVWTDEVLVDDDEKVASAR